MWVIRNAISATGVRTTVTTTRFEQNMIGLTLKKTQPLWLKEKKNLNRPIREMVREKERVT